MKELLTRSITGLLFVGLVIGSILWNDWAAVIVFGCFMLIGINEFTGLVNQHTAYSVQRVFTIIIAGLVFLAFTADFFGRIHMDRVFFLFIPIAGISLISSLFRQSDTPIQNAALGYFSWAYILVPFIMITHLCFAESNEWELIGMFVVIWTNDTMAYATGRLLGRTKLFERISPKKTWEGTIGGVAFALAAGAVWGINLSEFPLTFWLICSPLIALAAIFGDLFESQLKRQLGVKDSGSILPGHGGILDRFDAALIAIPVFYSLWMIYR